MTDRAKLALLGITGVAKLIELIAANLGKSTAEVLKDIAADCKSRAADPSDDSDRARAEIENDLPASER